MANGATQAVEVNPDTLIPIVKAPAPEPAASTPAAPPAGEKAPVIEPGDDDNEGKQGEQGEHGTRKPIQPRINELTRARHDAEREAAYWKGVATAKTNNGAPAEAPAPAAPPKPVVDNFKTYDEYVEALTDWKSDRAVEKALAKVNETIEERSAKQTATQQEEARSTNWQTRQEAIKKVITDYDDVVAESDVPIAPHVGELLLESDHGPAIAYKLAKDPSIAEKLNKMSPTAAAKEIGKMEMAFDSDIAAKTEPGETTSAPAAPAPPAATLKAVSKAPVPPTPVNTNASRQPDLAKMSMDDYMKARKAQGAKWGR
jgi:hypothetical protein